MFGGGGGSLGGNVFGAAPSYQSFGGLGVIPSNCWGVPAFENCKQIQWNDARGMCDPAYGGDVAAAGKAYGGGGFYGVPDCIKAWADKLTEQACLDKCPGGVNVGGGTKIASYIPGAPCADTNTVKFVQSWIGATMDGAWGTKSQTALAKYGQPYKSVAEGCTGDCPKNVYEPWCSGKQVSPCPAGQTLVGGKCVVPIAPSCGTPGQPCPCCEGLECANGLCRQPAGGGGGGGKSKASMMVLGIAGVLALGVGAYVMSQKKPHRPNKRSKVPRVGRGRIYRYA